MELNYHDDNFQICEVSGSHFSEKIIDDRTNGITE